ncbi:MAG: sugar ABC transporter ATP-binding protein [Actinobacteria bacterium]|nr:sugar ABC transporter ATP-binding protein [Actinomycetota bacterium]
MTTETPLLEVRGLAKHFGGIKAVIDGNLTVGRAEMVGLVGPNGCGKSTMLNVVSGFLHPDRGTVLLEGEPLPLGNQRKVQARGVLLVAQELALAPEDTVWQSVVLGAEPRRFGAIDRRRARRVAADALALLGHELPLDAPVGGLTPVDRRLVMIAKAAAHPAARLLILDEPTAGLPQAEARRVVEAMKKLVTPDRSLVLVSHHIEDIVSACTKVTLMRDGRTTRTLRGAEVTKDAIVSELLAGVSQQALARNSAGSHTLGEEVARLDEVRGNYLDGVSLTVRRGEVLGLAGILGSGVSEIIQLLTGQIQPKSGKVRVGAAAKTPSAPHRVLGAGVGFVSGDRSSLVIQGMTVAEHVALPALDELAIARVAVSPRRQRRFVADSLAGLSVKGHQTAMMTSLSGGNQQRALMSRWLDTDADLLVVDQPTVGVDIRGRAQLLGVLRDLAEDRGIVLAAEPEELAAICDRVLCLRRGSVVAEISASELSEASVVSGVA